MSIAYGSYFLMPLVLAVAVHLRGRRDDFVQMSSGIVLQMGLAFLLFLVFPAGPPRYYGPLVHGGFEPAQLHSWLGTYELQQRAFDAADPVRTRSAFPSLHCSLALFTLFAAFRHGDAVFPRWPRLYFWACAPVVVMLWLSTIYLRHHWIPDCAAGILLALLADVAARWLHDRWRIAARRSADAPAGVASWPPVVEERNDPVSARGRA
jgi:membrane-associated phospholipid phosphatase